MKTAQSAANAKKVAEGVKDVAAVYKGVKRGKTLTSLSTAKGLAEFGWC